MIFYFLGPTNLKSVNQVTANGSGIAAVGIFSTKVQQKDLTPIAAIPCYRYHRTLPTKLWSQKSTQKLFRSD